MLLFCLIALPFLAACLSLVCRNQRLLTGIGVFFYSGILAFSVRLAYVICMKHPVVVCGKFLRADALSAFFVILIALVSFCSLVYSKGYLVEPEEGELTPRKKSLYYFFFHIFVCAMLVATLVDNLGQLWVAIEMTTLASTFLVGFYNNKTSVEAAWKYLIICSVGITIALLGTVLLYYNVALHGSLKTLDWSVIARVAPHLDHRLMVVAFLFVLVGYGTKAGLVPMHTWLPDAHSQAMTPISALLSGVLLKTSIYALIRFAIIANLTLGTHFAFTVMMYAGLISIGVASFFLLVQKDLKRLLAYSSIENVGIIVFGIGVGTPLALFGALFHALNHACAKSLLFFSAGTIVKRYKTHNMNLIQGVIQAMPFTGVAMLVGLFAIVGMPPFAIFMSKLTIITAALGQKYFILVALVLLFLAVVFAALLLHLSKVVFGNKPKNIPRTQETLSVKLVFIGLIAYLIVFGLGVPFPLRVLLERAVGVMQGV
ncbi:MAG TPA: hydrogenase 4 subunit F [Candidatus Omnitrophota bacterium]|nr:hydrogenase 4 subunit F [Candidatus Omnitrophota bacterium]HPT07125.1 hydrogenase 4 subunit F [Candidatus Omnitrophota bacterium]